MLAAGEWKTLSNIQLCGLMGMATNTDDNEQIEKEFCSLSSFFKEVKDSWFADTEAFRELSMGMSHDYCCWKYSDTRRKQNLWRQNVLIIIH